jgi:sugar lactone lactonase YvrE
MYEANLLINPKNQLGECPIWCEKDQALYWIDIALPGIYQYQSKTKQMDHWSLPKPIGSFTQKKSGGFLLCFRSGFASLDTLGGPVVWLNQSKITESNERFNDGKSDALGRFWVGTMDKNLKQPLGALYRFDNEMKSDEMDRGFTISNGIAWSPDNKTMYFSDTPARIIYAYDFDLESGDIENRRIFATLDDSPGRPDGSTVDAEGFLWSARVAGGRIDRYDPSGKIERSIQLPISRPTSMVFGGPKMETLFITTSAMSLSDEQLRNEPLAGGVFSIETGIKGHLEHAFSG